MRYLMHVMLCYREYASSMRSVDVLKCWPFDHNDDDIVESLLPPITVQKFKWWSNELELMLKKNSSVDPESSEKLHFKRTTAKAKAKSRAPKKRSIVEIFTVAPQVEWAHDDYEDDDNDDDDGANYGEREDECRHRADVNSKGKGKNKNKKKTKAKLKDETLATSLIKLKKLKKGAKKKGSDKVDLLVGSIAKKVCDLISIISHGLLKKLECLRSWN